VYGIMRRQRCAHGKPFQQPSIPLRQPEKTTSGSPLSAGFETHAGYRYFFVS
jgi:hypothetical protein